ncbi:MAG: ATP-binding cassette domain-containing protein [Candidatus Pacebacteria bacterium]|nr:ATP-binding cassette domain-containing protein [Candidatus Paceibacterota bacterium]
MESSIVDAAEFLSFTKDKDLVKDYNKKLKIDKGSIEFRNVNFSYENNKEILFEDFNLKINEGERVGLVGVSGGGKTTITKLLLRLYEIQSGEILIDGQNIQNVSRDSLRKNISFVPQEPILFHRTLAENITYENQDATNEELLNISKKSHSYEFISKTENTFDTLVGERGVKLSGGQKQRISIARAMLKNSKILILDEATSALDSESEKFIQDSLFELMKNKTSLVIAHRLSTIKKLDRIIVIDSGKIIGDGTHYELLEKGGMYKKL